MNLPIHWDMQISLIYVVYHYSRAKRASAEGGIQRISKISSTQDFKTMAVVEKKLSREPKFEEYANS